MPALVVHVFVWFMRIYYMVILSYANMLQSVDILFYNYFSLQDFFTKGVACAYMFVMKCQFPEFLRPLAAL